MHPEARDFTVYVKTLFPHMFVNKIVHDVGSGDINGNNRFLFYDCEYSGNDVFAAKNVTIVSPTSKLEIADNTFDTIISTECFEHDPEYILSFKKIVAMLKPGGLFLFTCASTGRGEHGTRRTTPENSYGAIGNVEIWSDYYGNLTFEDLDKAVDVNASFSQYASYYNEITKDLYFWGIKKPGNNEVITSVYDNKGVTCTHKF
jgi:SAM-dependent methyltransferase